MKSTVTEEQSARYGKEGFLVVDEFLSSDELAEWREAVDHAVEQRGRFCVGCGKRLPPSPLPARRARLAPAYLRDDDTQPVLRFSVTPRMPLERQQDALV